MKTMRQILILFNLIIFTLIFSGSAECRNTYLAPDGGYVGRRPQLAPDGSYVGTFE